MRKLITTILTIIAVSACRPELSFLPESFHSPDAEISGDENAVSLVFSPKAGTASLSLESSRDWTASFVNNRARGWCSIPSESGGSRFPDSFVSRTVSPFFCPPSGSGADIPDTDAVLV